MTDKEHAEKIKAAISFLNETINAALDAGLIVNISRPIFSGVVRVWS